MSSYQNISFLGHFRLVVMVKQNAKRSLSEQCTVQNVKLQWNVSHYKILNEGVLSAIDFYWY